MKGNLLLLSFFITVWSYAQKDFKEIYSNNSRPSKENVRIPVADYMGNKGFLPVTILKGKNAGPVFTIIAGVHGFEYPPIIAVQELLAEIDPTKLSGDLIIVPIANRGSFYGREPFKNPEDQENLNNAFPGKANGSITQQIAWKITQSIIPVTDVFLDIHGGDAPEDLLSFICYYNNQEKIKQTQLAEALCLASGFENVVSYPYTISDDEPAKYAFKQAVQDGKTGLSIESGRLGIVHDECVVEIKKGVYNMLMKMEMYGDPSDLKPAKKITRRNHQVYIKSTTSGIFYKKYKAGDIVKKGALVGHTTDEFGKVIETYKAPIDGVVLYNLSTPPINKGDTVMCISTAL